MDDQSQPSLSAVIEDIEKCLNIFENTGASEYVLRLLYARLWNIRSDLRILMKGENKNGNEE